LKRILLIGAASAVSLFGVAAVAAPAMASSGPAQYVTHTNGHPDTTSLPQGYPLPGQDATQPSTGGPVWAFDNNTVKFTVTPESGPGNYRVSVDVVGSFHGFADPTTGAALTSDGSDKGTIAYDVLAAPGQAPDPAGLPSQEAGGIGGPTLRDMISQLFDGNETVVGGGDVYTFSYQNGNYVQVGAPSPATRGDVRGH
jgi:hypothetical protein